MDYENENYNSIIFSNWIIVDNTFFTILRQELANRKTPIYHIYSKTSKDEIGQIKWYGAWRKFCFFPNEETIWDSKCLNSLMEFLDEINKDYRKEIKKND